jgi:hypothetical protein
VRASHCAILPGLEEVHMRRFGWLILAAAAATACGSGSGGSTSPQTDNGVQLMAGFDPGPAPDPSKGFQIITPAVSNIKPGDSLEYCTDTGWIAPEDVWVDGDQGMQSEGGHHVILFYTFTKAAPGTHLCGNAEMSEFQFGLPAGGGPNATRFSLPGNLSVKIPKGAQVVINHHYLNASATTLKQAQSAINVYYSDPSVPHTASSIMTVLDTSMTVPKGASSYGIDCTMDKTYQTWTQLPHMHALGTNIAITVTPAATGAAKQIFNVNWESDYAFDFSAVDTVQNPATPFVFNKGDKVHIQCDYLNNTGVEQTFGYEMCVLATFTLDPTNEGGVVCDHGQWGPI